MTDLDIDAIQHSFRTNPEVVAVCQLAKEQREVIKDQAKQITFLAKQNQIDKNGYESLVRVRDERIADLQIALSHHQFLAMIRAANTAPTS